MQSTQIKQVIQHRNWVFTQVHCMVGSINIIQNSPNTVKDEVSDMAAEIKQLKKELARVTQEREILKKAAAYFARETQ